MKALIFHREYGDPAENSITGPADDSARPRIFCVEIPLGREGASSRLLFRKQVQKIITDRGLFVTTAENMTEAFIPWHEIVRIEEIP